LIDLAGRRFRPTLGDIMSRTICSGVLSGFADFVREIGLDPKQLTAAAGVPVEALTEPGLRIPASALGRMTAAAAGMSGLEDFGLRLASRRNLAAWGAVALVMREQPTLRDVIDAVRKYFHILNETLAFTYVEDDDQVEIHVNVLEQPQPAVAAVGLDTVVGQLFLNLREIVKGGWAPTCVCFRHARPRSTEPYQRFFGVDVLFGQPFDGLIFPRRDLKRPLTGANPLLARHVEAYADQLLRSRPRPLSDKVVEIVILLLPEEECTRDRVAAALGMGVRKMQRGLADEGTTFAQLLDEARRRLTAHYLADTRLSIAEISGLLGYRSQAAFSVWFRDRYGAPPSAWRRRNT
jgi:AraC-like DNA-binding protein